MRPNMMMGAICLISAAAFAACQPSQPVDAVDADPEPLTIEARPAAPKATVSKGAPKKAIAKPSAKTPAVSNAIASTDAPHPVSEARAVEAKHQDELSVATTITGCLVLRDDGLFQLKDTDGEHAPKARSWKSGFIKKGSATIDVFDAGNRLNLGSHVGYRVNVVGTLTDREMRARSVRATSEPCD